ncbi:unnamed protein product [Phytophthora lilii]|uniref:Unnamed protein product n=1 Tax=Phytophthora lilii TaxID=2077276 RepID=A0A9W6XE16_9STRA|nr:unnamed protein product [Phytophthora lilii]
MRKLPSSASAGNLRQLVDSAVAGDVFYGSNGSSLMLPSAENSAGLANSSSSVAMSGMSLDVNEMDKTQPLTLSVGGDALSGADDRGKKSLAYRHTKFLRFLEDDFGKGYERRGCNYCDAGFSFKGGTTSAALRHLKTTHPERLVYRRRGGRSGVGDFSVLRNSTTGERIAEMEQALSTSPASERGSDHAGNDNAHADAAVARSVNESEEEGSVLSVETTHQAAGRSSLKRKRENDNHEDSATPSNAGETSSEARSVDTNSNNNRRDPSNLTASQEAILHFLHHYANELPQPAMRLRFAKHLTHNVAEAEMYNVLDPATQLEYIREFTQPGPTTTLR